MNQKQIAAMWLGIFALTVVWITAPREYKQAAVAGNRRTIHGVGLDEAMVEVITQPSRLFSKWIMVGAVTSGAIVTLKTREKNTELQAS